MHLRDLWVHYGRGAPWVLREVHAELQPGEVGIVAGRNGAGKSTLLSVIAGIRPATRGTVDDRPTVVGWVPERFAAAQPFTARRYLLQMAAIRGLTAVAARAAVDRWAQRLYLTPFLGTKMSQLSKGSAQKVGLAQALLVPPGLLVLDEPWEGLDAQTREEIPALIAEVTAAGGMVLVSDHRGETVKMPHTTQWLVHDGRLTVTAAGEAERRCVIEISVAQSQAESTAARLRADGHDVLAVRL
ncbi:ABC transporter ATP-binding protein [Rhizocola hellebori]|uniref:ABC transporter ATP-binding protein n=1 Tax=Rhizocola hellebori TaxID=1392758 RepID=A0A8J3QF26_9ACTN|nr:ATP-binding cassette domain-containing protein [Rhizocola hellebori]GIH08837.1 ABC transporter ATP-binding protein [Rhizocola hellebori]